jgi:hypothetical protein
MNLDIRLNEIKNQSLPFSHAILRYRQFKRMYEQLQGVSIGYPQLVHSV